MQYSSSAKVQIAVLLTLCQKDVDLKLGNFCNGLTSKKSVNLTNSHGINEVTKLITLVNF